MRLANTLGYGARANRACLCAPTKEMATVSVPGVLTLLWMVEALRCPLMTPSLLGFQPDAVGHLVIITPLGPVLVSQVLLVTNYTTFSLFPHFHAKHVAFLGKRANLITVNKMELQVFLITPHLAPV